MWIKILCWHEIKTTGVSSTEVSISYIEQLDRNDEGKLVIYGIDRCVPEQTKAFTLYGLVHNVIELILQDGVTHDEFVLKLVSAGYIDMKEYDRQYYSLSSKQVYHVDTLFLRMRRSDIPAEITKMEYQISIPSIKNWEK